ncbi:uncharacterized protein EI90DRAFT_2539192 [Cantharellus anzutake]|uniref:uncharacterized protein n=1 Tax=Cantharellus anzutake TaxID=1750568 RepID=UPI0019063EAE|nr:uncharacterized protein EI90DRAFT_2539192 [Cantharellus anzutake]KAF8338087.1 hypothetical protein EI90DRAFT_2539192 [Cantharellus anzutake]
MATLSVPSIHCESCEKYIKTLLSPLSLGSLEVSHIKRTLSFSVAEGIDATPLDSLLPTVCRTLYEAGYEPSGVYNRATASNLVHRLYGSFFGGNRMRRRSHLRHCFACQQESFQGSASSVPVLLDVKVDDPSEAQVQETRISIEGMTCS